MIKIIAVVLVAAFSLPAMADGLTLGGTRLIYKGSGKEASIHLNNSGKSAPQLVQAWVSDRDGKSQAVPFVVVPPVAKVGRNSTATIRVLYIGSGATLPSDRESQWLLNVRSIPATEKKDNPQRLTIATQNIIKLIYRPEGLTTDGASRAGEELKVMAQDGGIRLHNPTRYVVSLAEVFVDNKKVERPGTIQPFQDLLISVPKGRVSRMTYRTINDFGGMTKKIDVSFN